MSMQDALTGQRNAWRGCLGAILVAGSLLMTGGLRAATIHVAGGSGAGHESFMAALVAAMGEAHTVLPAGSPGRPDITIALHASVLPAAREAGGAVLAVMPEPERSVLQGGEGVVYWAPSWTEQLRLAKQIFPSLRRAGLLLETPADRDRVRALRDNALQLGLELVVRETTPEKLVRDVAELAGSSDVIIAPADSRLFTRHTVKPVLLAAYRQNRVFIGPSPAVVKAGALAALHVPPEALAREVAERIQRYLKEERWGVASRMSRFQVTTNPQVARALGLRLDDAEQLSRDWRREEGTPWP